MFDTGVVNSESGKRPTNVNETIYNKAGDETMQEEGRRGRKESMTDRRLSEREERLLLDGCKRSLGLEDCGDG